VAAGADAVQKEGARIRRLFRRELAGASRNGRCRGWKRCSHCGQPRNKCTTAFQPASLLAIRARLSAIATAAAVRISAAAKAQTFPIGGA